MTMSFLENLFAPGTIERLGWMLIHVLWQATAVALLLAVFLRLLRNASANVRYGAACSALALMVVLPLATMRYLRTPGPVAEAGPASVAVVLPTVTEGATPQRSLSVPDSGYASNPEDTLKASLSVPPILQAPEPMTPIPLREHIVSILEPSLPYVVLGWLIGVFGLSAWHLGGWTQLQRLKRRMVRAIGDPLQRRLEDLSARLGMHRAVGLLESALVEVPTVVGWLRPVILLPASALTGLRPEQLEAILAHELAHIRRYDYLVNMLQTVVEILGFYHPAIWWVSHRIREERENCCDDLAVYVCGSSLQYAKALACMEEIRHGGTSLAVAATGGSLLARIARLLGRPAVEDRRFVWLPGLVALLLVVAIIIPAALTLGAGNQPPSSTDTQENYQAPRQEHEAQAAPASPSSEGTATQAEEKETDTGRADAAAPNAPDQMGEVLLQFQTANVRSDLRPDRETLLLLANTLGVESPLARELGRPGRQFDMTVGEILKRYIAPQSLSQPAAQALLHLLQSRGYLDLLSAPNMVAQDNKQAQIRITTKEHFWTTPKLERIWYGMALDVTPHLTDDNRVALDLMVELRDPAPGVNDSNQPKVSRTSAETSMIAPNDRYLIWAAVEQAADQSDADKGRQSLYIMVKPTILQPAPGYAGPAGAPKPAKANPRQVLLDIRTVTMERGGLLHLGVQWGWPTVKAGVFSGDSTRTNAAASPTWPYGVQIGYTPDQTFTDSLLMALNLLQENGQAQMSGQQILAQDGRKCQIKALTEEWYTVTAQATKPSSQSPTETHKMESGMVVTMTPRIGNNGDITLESAFEVSTSLPRKGSDLPLVTRRTAKNAVTIKDGGTVAVAGMTENSTGPNDKSAHETAIFVTAHLIPDANEPAPPASPSAEPATQAPQAATDANGKQATVTAVFADADLLIALAQMSQRTGVQITPDATVKTTPVTAEFTGVPLATALPQILKNTPYVSRKLDDGTYLVFRPLSFRFPQVELVPALQDLSAMTGVPIVADPDVTGTVNAWFTDVSLDTAFEMLLAGKPYVFKRMPHYYLVASRGLPNRLPETSVTRRIGLNYTQPAQAKQLLSPAFAPYVQVEPSGTQNPNNESHTLIVTAPPALADRIVADIKQIDRSGKQVLLEARVVAIEPNEIPNLGVAWAWPPVGSLLFSSGGKRETQTPIGPLLDRGATDSLMMTLNQLQENGRADIIANPKVVALDGRQAQMKVVQEQWLMMTVPATEDDSSGRPELRKVESDTVLAITPHIGDNKDITLRLAVAVNDSVPAGGSQRSFAARHEVTDSITLRDGGTVGVARVVRIPPESRNRTPTLADLPLIGEPFKTSNKPGRELVVFITAHLVPDTGRLPLPTAVSIETKAQAQDAAPNARAEQAPTVDQSASRAWYILRQLNGAPLLLGLTQQLLKVLQPPRRNDAMWQEVTEGGSLKLDIKVERETGREIVVGLFQDAKWSQEPAAVRLLPKEGTYTLTGLPAGRYQIGAMIGRAPSAAALGVQRTWPQAVEIQPGRTTEAQLLVTRDFAVNASGWHNREVSRDYTGDWSLLKENRLLQGRLTGPDGNPIPFGRVSVREYQAVPTDSIAAPELGTNEAGVYRFDKMKWPYRVGATWSDPLPALLGYRYQYKGYNRVFEGPQQVDFQFDPFPVGTARLAGRVVDEQGAPVTTFYLRVRILDPAAAKRPEDEVSRAYGYAVPFLSADGSFTLSDLPPGRAIVNVAPFDYRLYRDDRQRQVVLEEGRTTEIQLDLVHNKLLYGRVVFEDGRPTVISPAPWEGAKTTLRIDETVLFGRPVGHSIHDVAEADAEGWFAVYLPDSALENLQSGSATLRIRLPGRRPDEWQAGGVFPFEKLAEDTAQAGTVTIRPPNT
ncbi:MAG: M48 family metalloprotease [Planctomycetes bacterium]|nr:M48 family metalloprotease [Planctomycetota bacterium]